MVMDGEVRHGRAPPDDDIVVGDDEEGSDDPYNMAIMVVNPDRYPHVVLRGRAAGLAALRHGDAEVRHAFFAERSSSAAADSGDDDYGDAGDDGDDPYGLLIPSPMSATLTVGSPGPPTERVDDEVDEDEVDDEDDDGLCVTPGGGGRREGVVAVVVPGHILATGSQLLFVAADRDHSDHDLAIGASCIVLHAMTDDGPDLAVYLQLNDDDGDGDDHGGGGPVEVTVTPTDARDCQLLFNALCRMVSLHPFVDDDGDDAPGDQFGDFDMGDDDDDELIWAPATAGSAVGPVADGYGPSDEERTAMLERLDGLLVVRPEFEIQDGQFDDPTTDVVDVNVEEEEDEVGVT